MKYFDTSKHYKFIGFKMNIEDNDDDIIYDFDKKYISYNCGISYKCIQNIPLKFVEKHNYYYYFTNYQPEDISELDEESNSEYHFTFIFADDFEYSSEDQLSDQWFPVIIEM